MKGLFVTGTDTGVGKTLVTGYLATYLSKHGWRVITQKWVETGCDGGSADIRMYDAIAGREPDACSGAQSLRCPYLFRLPASPHLAAAQEGRRIDPAVIEAAYRTLAERSDIVIVEGAGGALVPLDEDLLIADLAARLDMAALVVVRNRLGCVNHSLLTLEALAQRAIPVVGLVLSRLDPAEDEEVLRDNPRVIAAVSGTPVLGEMPALADTLAGAEAFEPVGRTFVARWREMRFDE